MPDAKPSPPCPRCRDAHDILACPYVKAVEFEDGDRIRRLEFLTPADYGPAPKPSEGEREGSYPKLGG